MAVTEVIHTLSLAPTPAEQPSFLRAKIAHRTRKIQGAILRQMLASIYISLSRAHN